MKVVVKGPAFDMLELQPVLFAESSKRHCGLRTSRLCHAVQ